MTKKAAIFFFIAIFIFAAALRFINIDRCLINDELRTIRFASSGILAIFSSISQDSYPPFPYISLLIWMNISDSDIWIRLLFIIFGILSVGVSYMLAKKLLGLRYALIAMFMMAIIPMQVWISQYIRGISPAIFFLLLSVFFFFILAAESKKWKPIHAIGYVASSVFAIYSFYLSFFIIAAQNILYLFFRRHSAKQVMRWFLLQAFIFLSFIPWLGGFFAQTKYANILKNFTAVVDAGISILGMPIGTYIRTVAGFLGLDQAFLMQVPVAKMAGRSLTVIIFPLFFLIAAIAIFFVARFYKRIAGEQKTDSDLFSKKEIMLYFSLLAVVPLILSIALNLIFKTPLTMRYMAPSSAFLAFVYALMLAEIKKVKILFAVLAVLAAISIFRIADFNSGLVDYRSAAKFVSSAMAKDDCLLFIGGEAAYAHYAEMPVHHVDSSVYIRPYIGQDNFSVEDRVNRDALHHVLLPYNSLWIYQSGEQMTGIVHYVRGLLKSYGYSNTTIRKFRNLEVFYYKKGV